VGNSHERDYFCGVSGNIQTGELKQGGRRAPQFGPVFANREVSVGGMYGLGNLARMSANPIEGLAYEMRRPSEKGNLLNTEV